MQEIANALCPAILFVLVAIICFFVSFYSLLRGPQRQSQPITVALLPTTTPRQTTVPPSISPPAISTTNNLPPVTTATMPQATTDKFTGLLTPPTTPTELQDPYSAFLSLMVPSEMANAPADLLQEVLFADMEGELREMLGGDSVGYGGSSTPSTSSIASSFASIATTSEPEGNFVG